MAKKPSSSSKQVKNQTAVELAKIPKAFDKLKLLQWDSKAKVYKETKDLINWQGVFELAIPAGDIATEISLKREQYKEQSQSIYQYYMQIARLSGSLEQFNTYHKAMLRVWKDTGRKGNMQPVYDSANIMRRAFKLGVSLKIKSINKLKEAIKEAAKLDKSGNADNVEVDSYSSVAVQLAAVYNQLLANGDKDNMSRLENELIAIGKKYQSVIDSDTPMVDAVVPNDLELNEEHVETEAA